MSYSILVALDGSPLSEQVLPSVSHQARRFDGRIVLLSIVTPDLPLNSMSSVEPMWFMPFHLFAAELAERKAERCRYLNALAARLKGEGLEVDCLVASGLRSEVSDIIVRHCLESSYDLVAMATHGHAGWRRILHGSVTQAVASRSRVPVLVFKSDSVAGPQIGVRHTAEDLAPIPDPG
jgi:nucleotide-binding universal stress UspA family protein